MKNRFASSDESIHRHEGWKEGDAAFRQNFWPLVYTDAGI